MDRILHVINTAFKNKDESSTGILRAINLASIDFLKPLSLEETYKVIADKAIELVNCEYASIFLAKEDGELERVYCSDQFFWTLKFRKRGYTYSAYKNQKVFVLNNDNRTDLKRHEKIKQKGIKSTIFISLNKNKKSIGVLTLDSTEEEHFSKKELSIIKLFGTMATLAIEKAKLYDEMQKSLETRDLFISMAAHEFKTPITTIHGYIQLLEQKFMRSKSAEGRWIKELSFESERLIHLTNELLEVNRIKTGQLNYSFKECSLRNVLNRSVENFNVLYPSRTVILKDKIGKKDLVIADQEKLEQVAANLLENAAKFSSEKKEILVQLGRKKNFLTFEITDKGEGIPKKIIPKVLGGFFQANKSGSGMGIGFFLIKNIIKLHKGSIDIQSKIGKGTRVIVSLPVPKSFPYHVSEASYGMQ